MMLLEMSISGGVRIVVRVDQEIDPYRVRHCRAGLYSSFTRQ